jgi:hypothetical protein
MATPPWRPKNVRGGSKVADDDILDARVYSQVQNVAAYAVRRVTP